MGNGECGMHARKTGLAHREKRDRRLKTPISYAPPLRFLHAITMVIASAIRSAEMSIMKTVCQP